MKGNETTETLYAIKNQNDNATHTETNYKIINVIFLTWYWTF